MKIAETKEGLQLPLLAWHISFYHSADILGIHRDLPIANDHSEVFNLIGFKLTFLWFEVEFVFLKNLKDAFDDLLMVFYTTGWRRPCEDFQMSHQIDLPWDICDGSLRCRTEIIEHKQ